MTSIVLSGSWDIRFAGDSRWRPVAVPGCWEGSGVPKDAPGPAWYRARFVVPAAWAGQRLWLHFGAVSYHCTVHVNGRLVGSHTGLWDSFRVEITGAVAAGEEAEVVVQVEKPASLTRGPASEPVPGAFPLRETLAGFLPYVWGHMFGGIWQDVVLAATGQAVFGDVHVRGSVDGRVQASVELLAPGTVTFTLRDPDGRIIDEQTGRGDTRVDFAALVAAPRPWSPHSPDLYAAHLHMADGDARTIRFGLRSLRAGGTTIMLNDQPLYPRMALSWGWYPTVLHCNPGPERVRRDFLRLKRMGYNGVKLCLWFPPHYYFDLADEMGMLLWVELPMWLPDPTPFFRHQTPIEYDRLVRMARNHPSVILYSLGCELNRTVGADILGPLYTRVKELAGEALVRDNSGSGEAYGGLLDEHADYYDHHFYSDLPFLRQLLDTFAPRWRPQQPWLCGEFCDYDTFRDLRRMDTTRGAHGVRRARRRGMRRTLRRARPWWTLNDPQRNPQGARWQYDLAEQEARLRANGYWRRAAALERISARQGLLHRKWTLELVRTYREIGGYVVTGEVDTPITTAGMWDERGRIKFDPEQFRSFNNDLVVLIGWDRRRAWVAGGDRAAYWDTWSYTAGSPVRPHLIASHYGRVRGTAQVTWHIAFPGELPWASGEAATPFDLAPGDVRELTVAGFIAPEVRLPRQAVLRASVRIGGEETRNAWPLWFFPRDVWKDVARVALIDPAGRLEDLRQLAPSLHADLPRASVVIATAWTPAVEAFVSRGGAAILLQSGAGPAGPILTAAMPFWREAVRIVEPHPAWGDFPHGGWAGLQFFGCATDYALDTAAVSARPILRRLDTRTMRIHDYAAEIAWGTGRLLVSTLRFEGGQGEQPSGISRNTAAAYLLWCWVRYLLAPV